MHIEIMIKTLESQISVLNNSIEALRLIRKLAPVPVKPEVIIINAKLRVSNDLLRLVFSALRSNETELDRKLRDINTQLEAEIELLKRIEESL